MIKLDEIVLTPFTLNQFKLLLSLDIPDTKEEDTPIELLKKIPIYHVLAIMLHPKTPNINALEPIAKEIELEMNDHLEGAEIIEKTMSFFFSGSALLKWVGNLELIKSIRHMSRFSPKT